MKTQPRHFIEPGDETRPHGCSFAKPRPNLDKKVESRWACTNVLGPGLASELDMNGPLWTSATRTTDVEAHEKGLDGLWPKHTSKLRWQHTYGRTMQY